MDSLHLTEACYSDGILLVSSSLNDLSRMFSEARAALLEVGIEIGIKRSHWTCWPKRAQTKLNIDSLELDWTPGLVFVGPVLDLSGTIEH